MRSDDHWLGPLSAEESVNLTVLLKPPEGLADQLLSGQYHPPSAGGTAPRAAAESQALAAVRDFASDNDLTILSEDPASRRVVLAGRVQQMNRAFGVELGQMRDPSGHTFRSFRGSMQIPPQLQNYVTAVLGLDQRPVAHRVGG